MSMRKQRILPNIKHAQKVRGLFASGVVSVTFRLWPILSFSGPLLMMLFAFLNADKHPLVFIINTTAKQRLNNHDSHSP